MHAVVPSRGGKPQASPWYPEGRQSALSVFSWFLLLAQGEVGEFRSRSQGSRGSPGGPPLRGLVRGGGGRCSWGWSRLAASLLGAGAAVARLPGLRVSRGPWGRAPQRACGLGVRKCGFSKFLFYVVKGCEEFLKVAASLLYVRRG